MLNQDSKWIYDQLSSNGYDVGTEEHFSELLANEVDSKWIYDESTKLGLDLGTYDHFKGLVNPEDKRKLFPNASWSNLSMDNIKRQFSESGLGGEVSQVARNTAEEDAKKREEEKERQEKINRGLSEKDIQDMSELAALEQQAASPVSINANGIMEVNTPQPVLNQYGMPTNITTPSNPDIDRQVETKKAIMPKYLTRGENTSADIAQNAYERAMNTNEGKNLITSVKNKYVTEFKQSDAYKSLLKDYYYGMATEDDINNLFDEQYGQKISDEIWDGILGENGIMREYYQDAENKLEARLRTDEAFEISSRIEAEREKKRNERKDGVDLSRPAYDDEYNEAYKATFGVYPEDDPLKDLHRKGFNAGYKHKGVDVESIKFDMMLNHAEQFNNDALKLVDAVQNDRGFGKGLSNALTDIDTFDMGISELSRTKELIDILDKVDNEESLTEREELMLDAALNYFAVSSYYSDKLGRGYKAGQTTGHSIPFIVQFMLTSGALAGVEAAAEGAAKSVGKKIVKGLVKHGYKKMGKVLSSKAVTLPMAVVGGALGAGAEAAVMTSVFGLPQIEAGTQRRMLGDVVTSYDPETGEMQYLGRENMQTKEEARKNATIDTYVEYLSEIVLSKAFSPIAESISTSKWFKNFQRDDLVGTIVDIWNNPTWNSIRQSTKIGSLPEEYFEEVVGGILRFSASDVNVDNEAVGLERFKEAGLDLDSQIDIVLGLAPTTLLFGSVGAISHYGGLHRNAKHIKQSLSSDAQRELFDRLMKESRSGQFGDMAHDMIRDIVLDNNMSIEDKKIGITSIVSQYQELLSEETQRLAKQINETENAANIDEYILNTRNGATDFIYQTIDSKGRVCSIVDGKVEISQSEGGWNQIDQSKSSAKVKVRYRKPDGSFTEPIEISTSLLTAPVNVMNTNEFKALALAKSLAKTTGEETFEYGGYVYDTKTGIKLGTKEEYAKSQEEAEEKENAESGEPKVNTRPHKIYDVFTVNVDGKEVTMKVYSNDATQKKDGSIKGGKFSISVDGSIVTGERKEVLLEALSDKFKADHAKAVEEYNKKQAEVEPVQEVPIISDEDRAARTEEQERQAKEIEKQTILDGRKRDKSGEIDMDKLTPEETVLTYAEEETPESLMDLLTQQLQYLRAQIVDIQNKDLSPIEKKNKTRKIQQSINAYEAAISKWLGDDVLVSVNAMPIEAPAAPVAEPTPVPETTQEPEVLPEPEVAPEVEMEEQIEDTPVEEEEVAEEVAAEEEVPVAEVPAREPIDLSSDNIVFVKQAHRVAIAERGEDGVLRFVDNGKVVGDTWMEMPNKILVYYNGQPCYALTTVSDPKYFSNEVNIVSKDYVGNVMKVSRWDLTNEDGKKLLKTGAEIQEERVNSKYKSIADFLNTVIYTDVKNNIKLTLRELFAIPVIDANRGRRGAPSYRFQVERFIENQSSNREDKAIRDEIRKHLQELVQDWNAYVKINNLTDVVDEENMSSFYSAMKQQGGYKSNGLLVQTQDFSVAALNSADITKNPVLQLAVVLDQASELGMLDENVDMSAVDNFSSIKQKLAEPSEMTTEDIQQEMKDIELERAKSNNSVLGKNRYNKLKRELNKRVNTNPTDAAEPAQETAQEPAKKVSKAKQVADNKEQFIAESLAERDFIIEELNQGRGDMQRLEELNQVLGILGVEPAYPNAQVQETEIAEEVIPETTEEDEAPETIAEEVLPEEETEEEVPTQQVSAETIKREIEKSSERLGKLSEEQEEEFDAILAQIQEKNALLESIGEGYKEEKTEKPKANKTQKRGVEDFNLNDLDDIEYMVDQQVQESSKAAKVIINLLKKAGVRVVEVTEQQIEQMVGKDEYKKLTADGVVYGAAHKGMIYLNSEHLNPNTPLHEFTHLWVDWYKNEFKEEWERFVKLAVKSKVAKQLKTKEAYKNLNNDDLASEVLSRYTGYTYGAMTEEEKSEFENLMKETGSIEEQIAEKPLRKAIREFWKRIISIFDKTVLEVKEEEAIDDMIRRFSKLPMLALAQGEEAVSKFMTGKSAEKETNFDKKFKKMQETLDKGGVNVLSLQQISELTDTLEDDLRQGNKPMVFERLPQGALQTLLKEQRLLREALLVAALRSRRATQKDNIDEDGLSLFGSNRQMEFDLRKYAKEKGLWHETPVADMESQYGESLGYGHESIGVWNDGNGYVVKVKDTGQYGTLEEFLEAIVLNNWMFPENKQEITGFGYLLGENGYGEDKNGYFSVILKTPLINFSQTHTLSQEEKDNFMSQYGFSPVYSEGREDTKLYSNGDYLVKDLHDGNIVRSNDGEIYVIDAIIKRAEGERYRQSTPEELERDEQNEEKLDAWVNDRIQFMVGPAVSSPTDPMTFDADAAARIEIKTHKLLTTFANPKADLPKELGAIREMIANAFDRTEGIRWMQDSIKKFRKEHGLPDMGEGFDVRTMVEAMDSKIQNDTQAYINTKEKRLQKNIAKLAERVEKSSFYKQHKLELEKDNNGNDVILTPIQFIERYLIARDSIEREELNGNPRGVADFYRRMGMNMVDFVNAFHSALFSTPEKKKELNELWDSIRACTDVSIDMGWQSGLISFEEYTEYKKRKFYVPERDFAEVENNEELAIDSHGYRGRNSNKLTAIKQAKGGESLAANVLANICLLARDGIIKSHKNMVKKAMFDLLKANEDWCREYKVPIPKQVWYKKNADGTVTRMDDGPSAEDRALMNDLKSQIRTIEGEIANLKKLAEAATDDSVREAYENDILELNEQIDMLSDMFPYLDEFDTRNLIYMTNAAKNESTVIAYVDGVAQEMLFPNMSIIARALNGTFNKEGEWWGKKAGQFFAAGLTVYNPTFFTVNVVRDVPFIAKKGYAEYGFGFIARFAAQLGKKLFTADLWKVVFNSDYKSLKNEHIREFYAGGANTGYTTMPEIRELKKATQGWSKKSSIGWSDIKDILSYMNTFSEVWTRSAAYSVVREMGHTNEEALRAAKNLSVNFNRKGLGNKFMNFFGSMSIFMNAAIQGACGYLRAFKGDEDAKKQRIYHATRAAMQFMLLPAFTGFISTLLTPDDDEEKLYYSDYDRDNYLLLGFVKEGIRIPLNEQVKPFWCLGVNIALGMQERRTKEQITNSMVSTIVTNLLPLPPVVNSSIVMAINGLTEQKDFNGWQVAENLITPQALAGVYDLSNGVNFMGTEIRIEAGDKPQYILGENEEMWCKQFAWLAYQIGGGNKDYPSRTTTDGRDIWFDINPKEVSAVRNMFIPSTYRDIVDFTATVLVNKVFTDNPFSGEEMKAEDFTTIRRFYKPREKELGMYQITKEAKAIVKKNNERKANAQKLVKGAAITRNSAMRSESELRLRQTLSDRDVNEMKKYITIYEQLSIRERAKEFGLTEKQFMLSLKENNPEAYNILTKHNNVTREKAVDELLRLTRKYKSISIEDMNLFDSFNTEK